MKKIIYVDWNTVPLCVDSTTLSLILGVSVSTIKRWTAEGRLHSIKVGRKHIYAKEYIRELIEGGLKDDLH